MNTFNETEVKQILQSSYMNQNEARQRLEGMGYSYDNELSTNENKVFHDASGRASIVYRGTRPHIIKDLLSDWNIIKHTEGRNKRFQDAHELEKKVHQKYGKAPVLFGDSLGGTLAMRVGQAKGNRNEVYAHNPAINLNDMGKTVRAGTHIFRNVGDPVSILYGLLRDPHGNIKHKKVKGARKHRIVIN